MRGPVIHRDPTTPTGTNCSNITRSRDALTLQVLHSHVADLSDKFLPLEPVFPLVSSHLVLQGPWIRITHKAPPGGGGGEAAAAATAADKRAVYCPAGRPGASKPGTQAEITGGFPLLAGHRCCLLRVSSRQSAAER